MRLQSDGLKAKLPYAPRRITKGDGYCKWILQFLQSPNGLQTDCPFAVINSMHQAA